ncbi:MAG TPA: hypothetical protein VFJ70_00445 [Burkholderiales bacterium]|nr:hypothetical protein [Burkholderiales bacterium]
MSDTCTVEAGLLKKKTCGQPAVGKCANCEQPLCAKHRVPRMSAGKKTLLCPECARAWKASEKTLGELPSTPASMLPPQEEKKPTAAPAPAARPAPAASAPKKPEPPPVEPSGPLEFTPEPKKPDDKK